MEESNEIQNLVDYFAMVRMRPGMYLGTNQISKLHDHLQGYQMACSFNKVVNSVDDKFFEGFNQFVYSYYEVEGYGNWRDIILEQSYYSEQAALKKFFELFDSFFDKSKVLPSKKIVMALFDEICKEQGHLKLELGKDFGSIKLETVDLIKENLLKNTKSDFDFVLEQLEIRAEECPGLRTTLNRIVREYTIV
jgi:hypothetical protein